MKILVLGILFCLPAMAASSHENLMTETKDVCSISRTCVQRWSVYELRSGLQLINRINVDNPDPSAPDCGLDPNRAKPALKKLLGQAQQLKDAGVCAIVMNNIDTTGELVWGSAIKENDGSILKMNYVQARTCCDQGPRLNDYPKSCPFGANGQHLPSQTEYQYLAEQLGNGSASGYDPSSDSDLSGNLFWSEAYSGPGTAIRAWAFDGRDGTFGLYDCSKVFAVRCVASSLD